MPAPKDPNTAPARRAKREKKAAEKAPALTAEAGTLEDVKAVLWRCVGRVEALMTEGKPEAALVLKCVHAMVQACQAYTRVLEVGEIEARLAELEARLVASSSASAGGDGAATRPPVLRR